MRAVTLAAAIMVQIWSLVPVAASVIYCIGEDGHAGFELAHAGASDCGRCCPEGEGAEPGIGNEASGCTDIAISPAAAFSGKVSAAEATVSFVVVGVGSFAGSRLSGRMRPADFDPPRTAATRRLRHTVLLI